MGQRNGLIVGPSIINVDVYKQIQSRFIIRPHPCYPGYQQFKLLHEKLTSKRYLLRVLTTSLERERKSTQEMINKRLASKNQVNYGLIKLQYFIMENVEHICNTSPQTKFYLIFQIEAASTLRQQILRQGKSRDFFTEDQLLAGLQSLVNGLLWLRFLNTKNIYCFDGRFVLCDPLLCPATLHSKERYPSEQKLRSMGNRLQSYDPYESDLFAIGMCVLQAISIAYLDIIYKVNHGTISYKLIQQQINKSKYTKLNAVLQGLLIDQEGLKRRQYIAHFNKKLIQTSSIHYLSESNSSKTLKIHVLGGRSLKNNQIHYARQHQGPPFSLVRQQLLQHTVKHFSIHNIREQSDYNTDGDSLRGQFKQISDRNVSWLRDGFTMRSNDELSRVNSQMTIRNMPSKQLGRSVNINFPSRPQNSSSNPQMQQQHYPLIRFIQPHRTSYTTLPAASISSVHHHPSGAREQKIDIPKQIVNLKQYKNQLVNQANFQSSVLKRQTYFQPHHSSKVTNNYSYHEPRHVHMINHQKNYPSQDNVDYSYQNHLQANSSGSYQINLAIQSSGQHNFTAISPINYLSHKSIEQHNNFKNRLFQDYPTNLPSLASHSASTTNFPSSNSIYFSKPPEEPKFSLIRQQREGQIKNSFLAILKQIESVRPSDQPQHGYLSEYDMKESILVKQRQSDRMINEQLSTQLTKTFYSEYTVKVNNQTPQKQSRNVDDQQGQEVRTNRTIPEDEHEEQESYEQKRQIEGQYITRVEQNGSRYEGFYLNGMRNGYGTFYYRDGGIYQGEWKDNLMNGYGKLFYDSQKLAYDGYWQNDQFHGQGHVFNDNYELLEHPYDYTNFQSSQRYWTEYDGMLSHDLKEGHGKLTLSNRECYKGQFEKDLPHGKGLFHSLAEGVIHGSWQYGKLMKKC